MARRSARTSAAASISYREDDEEDAPQLSSPPLSKRPRRAARQPQQLANPLNGIKISNGTDHASPAQNGTRSISRKVAAGIVKEVKSEEARKDNYSSASSLSSAKTEDSQPKKKKEKKEKVEAPTHFETRTNVHGEQYEVEVDEEGDAVKRDKNGRRLAKRKKKDIAYDIPDVPQRDFRLEGPAEKREERKHGFRGELGYACLNTVLRWEDPPIFSSRTARIKTMDEQGPDYIKELGRLNARDMIPMMLWNEENGIRFMRLSSEVFPFASHEKYGYSLEYAEKELRAAGDLAKRLGHRLTMHPGQFTQLGSPRTEVIENSIRDLTTHCEMLDRMGMGRDSVMIIHGGGTFGDRQATLDRMRHTYTTRLPQNVKDRLVLENDEMAWSAEELLPLCKELDIPLVFDFHHDLLRPSSRPPAELLPEIQAIWRRKGITPKYHLSEPRPGASNLRERRAHSDRCGFLPPDLPADAFLMIEAKDKEQAVLELYRIYGLRPVKHESLRPPAKDIGVKTSGRKSKLGGDRLPRQPRKSHKNGKDGKDQKEEGDAGEDGAEMDAPHVSLNPKSLSKAERAIAKAKEAAKRAGKVYTGPGADVGEDEGIELGGDLGTDPGDYVKTSMEVLQDMHTEADWVRAELRAGRERRPFGTEPGTRTDDVNSDEVGDEDPNQDQRGDSREEEGQTGHAGHAGHAPGQTDGRPNGLMDDGPKEVLAQGAPLTVLTMDHTKRFQALAVARVLHSRPARADDTGPLQRR
ncbi:UV-endonuclease UvdE [Testicularia cyperi]|uniref:UV-endonuclease UvdE n=1 Tax=Testicularia cyperi TaxID=1882483 RepID=A0A317XKZ7_9BASI|nr:UV-endonuclease UvdE [Testicularia cyperi]